MKIYLIILIVLAAKILNAQNNFSLKLSPISYQFSDVQPELVKLKPGGDGKLAFEPGLLFSYEEFAGSNTSLKVSQAIILDKATKLSGSTQIMIKFRAIKYFKHSVYAGFGPIVHYRQSWTTIENYVPEPAYKIAGDWQYKFSWLSGEVEYNYYLNKYTDLSVSLNQTQAESIGLAIGFKYWFSKSPKKKRGCVSCPGLH